MSDLTPLGRTLGWIEVLLSVIIYGAIVGYIRVAQAGSTAGQAAQQGSPP